MTTFNRKVQNMLPLVIAFSGALLLLLANINHVRAGDPEDIIGPMNLDRLECVGIFNREVWAI